MAEPKSLKIDYPYNCFMQVQANFWDSLQKISQHHQIKCKYLMDEMSKGNEEENEQNEKAILWATESLKTIAQRDLRHYYLIYLMYNFCLSQPLTLNQLKKNFNNKIFPYYIFTLLVKKKEIHLLVIDFLEKKITILNKEKKIEQINQDKIKSVLKKMNTSIVIALNDDNNTEIEIFPEFFQQIGLIFKIIDFFAKCNKNDKIDNGEKENELSLLDDDTYTPKGILKQDIILKEHQNKLLTKDKRYAVLGPSQIIIFKDKSMSEIRNVVPLLPFATQLISDDKELIISFKYMYRDQSLTFLNQEDYFEWKKILKDIFNKIKDEKIEGITLYRIKEKKLNSKIMDLIDNEIKETEETITKLNEELEDFKKNVINDKDNKNDK